MCTKYIVYENKLGTIIIISGRLTGQGYELSSSLHVQCILLYVIKILREYHGLLLNVLILGNTLF